ncbi:AAA family ATPase [Roseibium sp.]|uniref:bifunctional aminoglycoside phosphotransferase/ATP-binding protein n=1 Tax=Roseibium sp. TaxID=1936156 RepID=UPI003A96BA58
MSTQPTPDDQGDVLAFLDQLARQAAADDTPHRIDTHANVIFLVGDLAYKLKRAVWFPFLDYSTLEKRRHACQQEIACNKANAPQIYRRVVALVREDNGGLAFGPEDTPPAAAVDWLVEMNRFDGNRQLDRIASEAPLPAPLCDQLAAMMLDAHDASPVKLDAGPAFFAELASYVEQNADAFQAFPDQFPPKQARELTEEARSVLRALEPLILQRAQNGNIRFCHGDAHTRNIILLDDQPVLFDAIEFSEAIATTDRLYDLAFLLMDLWEQDQKPAANLIFNRYLDRKTLAEHGAKPGEDEDSLAALPFYLMMRACIRAKIAAASADNQESDQARDALRRDATTYFNQAREFLGLAASREQTNTRLVGVGGLSGSGKSTLARQIACDIGRAPGARILRTDVERKALLKLAETEKAPPSAYAEDAARTVYARLQGRIHRSLQAGHSVIFDAVFAHETQRREIEILATEAGGAFLGLWLDAPSEVLTARVTQRRDDASDADAKVVSLQLSQDIGDMTWHRIDASGSAQDSLQHARELL